MPLRFYGPFVAVILVGCSTDRVSCSRTGFDAAADRVAGDAGYDIVARGDGAMIVEGTGSLPWRALYATPRNCSAPGDGAGNPILLALLRNETIEFVEADGCGEEVVVVSPEAPVEVLARRVGDFLGRHQLRERVAVFVGCDAPRADVR